MLAVSDFNIGMGCQKWPVKLQNAAGNESTSPAVFVSQKLPSILYDIFVTI